MPAILSIGHDVMLLKTRASVLRQTGADVISIHPSRLDEEPMGRYGLFVLCHTLTDKEVEAIANRLCDDGCRVLLLRKDADYARAARWEICGAHNPETLLRTAGRMLNA